jgi:hypothetical protein
MPVLCKRCHTSKAILKRPKTGDAMCRECFYFVFEEEIHKTITDAQVFKPGEKIGIGASGGKGLLNYQLVILFFNLICNLISLLKKKIPLCLLMS